MGTRERYALEREVFRSIRTEQVSDARFIRGISEMLHGLEVRLGNGRVSDRDNGILAVTFRVEDLGNRVYNLTVNLQAKAREIPEGLRTAKLRLMKINGVQTIGNGEEAHHAPLEVTLGSGNRHGAFAFKGVREGRYWLKLVFEEKRD